MKWKLYEKVEVAEHERGLLFRRGRFDRVLGPSAGCPGAAAGRQALDRVRGALHVRSGRAGPLRSRGLQLLSAVGPGR